MRPDELGVLPSACVAAAHQDSKCFDHHHLSTTLSQLDNGENTKVKSFIFLKSFSFHLLRVTAKCASFRAAVLYPCGMPVAASACAVRSTGHIHTRPLPLLCAVKPALHLARDINGR